MSSAEPPEAGSESRWLFLYLGTFSASCCSQNAILVDFRDAGSITGGRKILPFFLSSELMK